MSKREKILIIILIILAALSFSLFLPHTSVSNLTNNLEYKYTVESNTSVYNFMQKLRDEGKITFTEKTYPGMGKFIVSINEISGNGEQNWIYYVNGEKADVGVSNYQVKQGDIISWKYEKNY